MGSVKGGSSSRSESFSESASRSFVDPRQQDVLSLLRTLGADVSQSVLDQIQTTTVPQSSRLAGIAETALTSLLDEGGGDVAARADRLAAPQIEALGEDITTQLARQIRGAGGISDEFALGGSFGGGRNQVAEGIAQEGALATFAREAAGIRSTATDQALAADVARTGRLTGAIDRAGVPAGIGLAGLSAQLGPLQALADIVGGPTVLTESTSRSRGTTESSSQQGLFDAIGNLFAGAGAWRGGV